MTLRDYSRSRAILIGNGKFTDHEKIPRVPAPGCVAAMRDLLTSDLCGWPRDRIDLFEELPNLADLARGLVPAVREAEDALLVYYVGHGMLTMKGDLVLALKDTDADPEALPYTAMPYGSLADIMKSSNAATKLVILDCCYAETANRANFGTQSADMADAYPVDGLYFIGASKKREKAGFPLHGDLTYFTEAFIETVRSGVPGNPPLPELTVAQIFRAVRARLAASGLPEPADSGIRDAGQYPFAINAALGKPANVKPEDPVRAARFRLLDEAEQALSQDPQRLLGAYHRVEALLAIAAAAAPDDPDRTRRLTSEAMRLVAASTVQPYQIVFIAEWLAATSPKRAEQIATAIPEREYRDDALGRVAQAIAASDPDWAERVVGLISDARTKDRALAGMAERGAESAPDWAERLTGTIRDPSLQGQTLATIAIGIVTSQPRRAEAIAVAQASSLGSYRIAKVAEALAQVDLNAAERVARSITDEENRDDALESVAIAAAPRNLELARRVIADIATPRHHGWAAYNVAIACAEEDHHLAEEIARSIPEPLYRTWALDALARHHAESNSGEQAARLLDEALQACQSIADPGEYDREAASLAADLAVSDLKRALRVADTTRTPSGRAQVLSRVAVRAADTSYSHAERIAAMIPDAREHARTLVAAAAVSGKDGKTDGARRLLESARALTPLVSDLRARAFLLADIAVGLVAADAGHAAWQAMDEAEIVGHTIPDAPGLFSAKPRNEALRDVARTVFRNATPQKIRAALCNHAERIARAIPGHQEQADALTFIAVAMFSDNLKCAERAALGITSPSLRVKALLRLAAEFTSDPLADDPPTDSPQPTSKLP